MGWSAWAVWLAGIGDFAIPPQGNDDIWHGYLAERLTHMPAITAGTVAPAFTDSATPVVYYQYGLHLAAAVVHEVTGVSVAEALNGAWIVYVGLLLPFGIAALAWRLFPANPWVAFWAAAMSSSLAIFPYLTNGILPYTAALAMVPGLLALVVSTVDRRPHPPAAVVALVGLGVFVTHPSAAVAAAVLALFVTADQLLRPSSAQCSAVRGTEAGDRWRPWVGDRVAVAPGVRRHRAGRGRYGRGRRRTRHGRWDAPGIRLALDLAATAVRRPLPVRRPRQPDCRRGIGITLGLLIFGGPLRRGPCRHRRYFGTCQPVARRLASAGGCRRPRRTGRCRPCDRHGHGVVAAAHDTRKRPVLFVLAAVIGLPPVVVTAYDTAEAQSIVRSAWHMPRLVTDQDLVLFRDLADRAGPADKVLNSPVDGSTWMYALFEVAPVLPYSGGSNLNLPDVYRGAVEQANPVVACRTLAATGATYALVKFVRGNDPAGNYDVALLVSRYPDLFTVVGRSDSGVAYRIEPAELARCASG